MSQIGPRAQAKWADGAGNCGEGIPDIDNLVITFRTSVAPMPVAQLLPNLFCGIEFGDPVGNGNSDTLPN